MNANDNKTPASMRKNLYGFRAANLMPVAQSIAKDKNLSLEAATVVAEQCIVDEWKQGAQSVLSHAKLWRNLDAMATVAFPALGHVYNKMMGMPFTGILLTSCSIGAAISCVIKAVEVKNIKKQIYEPGDSINLDAKEYEEIYEKAQEGILNKFRSVKMVPTYCPS